jgi:hypothetical protein
MSNEMTATAPTLDEPIEAMKKEIIEDAEVYKSVFRD